MKKKDNSGKRWTSTEIEKLITLIPQHYNLTLFISS